ncbi:hypothetical protein GH742_10740 [Legionella sp. MW5194]|uniref:hypothetical protein n=1 Tax=Legionella sp. MW5194 TaxID=2662448 RepID=UPI00193DBF72|nr:hypothetical protein [Legionella sp. MW5194]QRN04317.1 hypothetical protein GH742_10740 [Legionella sp. MW5194]
MPDYKELLEKATKLPGNLVVAHDNRYSYVSMFFTSVLCTQAYTDALLIQKTAICLNHYKASEEDKKLILTGMYIYVARKSYSGLAILGDNTLLQLLHDHLKIKSFTEFSAGFIKACYAELDKFSDWVYEQRAFEEPHALYTAFPHDMKIVIQSPIAEEKNTHGCLGMVSDCLSGLRI